MTALAQFRDTKEIALIPYLSPRCFPVAAATSLYAGGMVATDASGNAVPASAISALKIWGIADKTVLNTVAAGFGTAGQLNVDVKPGVWALNNGAGVDAITAAHIGRICYASDDNTVNLTDGGGLRPPAGRIEGLYGSQVKVAVGEPSLWDEADDIDEPGATLQVKAVIVRNVVNGNVADLAAYTVASNAAVNDATLNVEGDYVLLVAQTTPAQNGLYRVGVVTTGAAPLTRVSPMPTGYVFVADEYEINVRVGTLFANTKWFNSVGGTVGTNTPAFFPESVTLTQALVAGTMTLVSVPILSATKSAIIPVRKVANTCTLTTGGYVTNGAATPGALGTSSVEVMAAVAAGTINVADISTLTVTITNR